MFHCPPLPYGVGTARPHFPHPPTRSSRKPIPVIPIKPQSRQKTQQSRLIVLYQGKRHFSNHPYFGESSRWIGRTVGRISKRVPGRNPLLGERTKVRASVPQNCLAASPHPPIKAKNPVIVHNQGISRQPVKILNPTFRPRHPNVPAPGSSMLDVLAKKPAPHQSVSR